MGPDGVQYTEVFGILKLVIFLWVPASMNIFIMIFMAVAEFLGGCLTEVGFRFYYIVKKQC